MDIEKFFVADNFSLGATCWTRKQIAFGFEFGAYLDPRLLIRLEIVFLCFNLVLYFAVSEQ
jgi:hypothetical protein